MSRWQQSSRTPSPDAYDERWRRLHAAGESVHGEADLVCSFEPRTVLDAGCGTGRVAVELARRGIRVVGVDLDAEMLAQARRKAPHLHWVEADLLDVDVDAGTATAADHGETDANTDTHDDGFDLIVMAGNVMVFVAPDTEVGVIANLARHLCPGGRLVAGFQMGRTSLTLDDYDRFASAAGLTLQHRWSTWDRAPYWDGPYAVSVHAARR